MAFGKFFSFGFSEPRYIRRTRAYLQEARMAMLEHSIAAEHYQSSAQMYAERATRLVEEIRAWENNEHYVPEIPRRYSSSASASAYTSPKAVSVEAPAVTGSVGVVRAA